MMILDLTFRLATPSDYDEILKLSEGIYDGLDYLPFRYHTWMKMENVAVMLAYYGDKLAGLVACSIVDEGRTAIRRAGRTLAEFRGQGVHKQLSQAMNEFIRRQYPSVCRVRFISLQSLPAVTKLVQLDMLKSYVKKKNLRSHQFSTTSNSILIEPCTKEYLCDVIFSSPVSQKLFSDGFVSPELFLVEPKRANIDYMQQECDLHFAIEKCSDGDFTRSVSFGVLSRRVMCMVWFVTVYTSDPVVYEAHLLYQFKRACEVIDDDFVFRSVQGKILTNHGRRVLQERLQVQIDEEMLLEVHENKFEQ